MAVFNDEDVCICTHEGLEHDGEGLCMMWRCNCINFELGDES